MGSGKTTIGKKLSREMKMEFIDTDIEIEKKVGKTISEIFEKDGEKIFRKTESQVIQQVSQLDGYVIATGGGAVLNPINMQYLNRNGVIFFLNASNGILLNRVKNQNYRPLLKSKNKEKTIEELIQKRLPFYLLADHVINAEKTVNEVIQKIQQALNNVTICTTVQNKVELLKALQLKTDFIEVRMNEINGELSELIQESTIPIIIKAKNEKQISQALRNGPTIIDLDVRLATLKIVERIHAKDILTLLSFHDFNKTPSLQMLLKVLEKEKILGDLGKIITFYKKPGDIDKIFAVLKKAKTAGFPLTAFLMGEAAKNTRLLAAMKGSLLTYTHMGKPFAAAQPSLMEIKNMVKPNE